MVFSIEYAHYDGSVNIDEIVNATNKKVDQYLEFYPEAQKTIMFDDIHSEITHEQYRSAISELTFQPDCIYLESGFDSMMQQIFTSLQSRGFTYTQEDGKDYLQKDEKRYNQYTTFIVRTESKGNKIFSCPALVAASYLYKLGHFDEDIYGVNGELLKKSKTEEILTVLPARYLQVEANARNIIELISEDYLKRMNYLFL